MINDRILEKLKAITPEELKILQGPKEIDRTVYMHKNKDVIENSKIMKKGKLIAVRPHTRFAPFPEHSHDYVEIVYMCKGRTTHIIDGETIHLKEGELLFLSPTARQEILQAGEEDIAVNFIVLPKFFDGILKRIGDEETLLKTFIIGSITNTCPQISYLHFAVADELPIQNLLENLLFTLLFDASDKRNTNQVTMGLVFLHLINCTEKILRAGKQNEGMKKVFQYIEEKYKTGTLSELSALLHYDISTISRYIKQKTGRTFTYLLQEERLSKAAFLLKNTSLTIEEIALNVGYENVSFFYRLFQKKYGITPKKYRTQ